jgi:hypothetical protein
MLSPGSSWRLTLSITQNPDEMPSKAVEHQELCRALGYHHRAAIYNPCLISFRGLIWNA